MKKAGLMLLMMVFYVIPVKAQFTSSGVWNSLSRNNKIYFLDNYVRFNLTHDLDHIEQLLDKIDQSSFAIVGIGIVMSNENRGVVVNDVFKGTPAERVGLTLDDVILAINGETVRDKDGLYYTLKDSSSPIKLIVLRDGEAINFSVNKESFGEYLQKELKQSALRWRKKFLPLKNRYEYRFSKVLFSKTTETSLIKVGNDKDLDALLKEARDLSYQLNKYYWQMRSENELIQEKYLVPKSK
jgi:hypothetical protein